MKSPLITNFFLILAFLNSGSAQAQQLDFFKSYQEQRGGGNSIKKHQDGSYFVCGGSTSTVGGNYFLHHMDSVGTELWCNYGTDNIYLPCQDNKALDFTIANDDNFYLIGNRENPGTCNMGSYLAKVDSSGNELFTKAYYFNTENQSTKIIQTADDNFVFGGIEWGNGISKSFLMKVNSAGDSIWRKSYSLYDSDNLLTFFEKSSGNISLFMNSFRSSDSTYFLTYVETNSAGDTIFTKLLSDSLHEYYEDRRAIQMTADNGFAFIEKATSQNSYLVKLDSLMNVEWSKQVISPNNYSWCLIETPDNGYLVANGLHLLRTNSSGDSLWAFEVPSPNTIQWWEFTNDIVFEQPNRYIFCTRIFYNFNSANSGSLYRISDNYVGVNEVENASTYTIVFPNPCMQHCSIEINSMGDFEISSVDFFDLAGRKLFSFDKNLLNGNNKIEIPVEALGSGIYFYSVLMSNSGKKLNGRFIIQ